MSKFDGMSSGEKDPPRRVAGSRGCASTVHGSLSRVEQQVFDLLQDNFTEQAIATKMRRSPEMIHQHMRNIYRKCLLTA